MCVCKTQGIMHFSVDETHSGLHHPLNQVVCVCVCKMPGMQLSVEGQRLVLARLIHSIICVCVCVSVYGVMCMCV